MDERERNHIHGDDPEATYLALVAMVERLGDPLNVSMFYAGLAAITDIYMVHPELLPVVAAAVAWARDEYAPLVGPAPDVQAAADDFVTLLAKAEAIARQVRAEVIR